MNILVTGAKGFIGKNLIAELNNIKYGKINNKNLSSNIEILEYDTTCCLQMLDTYCKEADFIFHLAGINRPKDESMFMSGNLDFTSTLIEKLKKYNNKCPIMIASSVQATLDNPYGRSKKAAEELLIDYSKETGAKVLIYRFTNIFGKWSRPNYNSVVATFCNNIAKGLPIQINDRNASINLIYIDDLVEELINALIGKEHKKDEYCYVPVVHETTIGNIADLIYSFNNDRKGLNVPNTSDDFIKKLYSTYLSFLPQDNFSYPLKMNIDERGSFTELIRTPDRGQFSVNIFKPHITKGNHWHNTKNEKFVIVKGNGVIRFRKIGTKEIIEYFVSGDKLEIIDIPTGYTHNIENLGDTDMIAFIWSNECFDPKHPDTYFEKV